MRYSRSISRILFAAGALAVAGNFATPLRAAEAKMEADHLVEVTPLQLMQLQDPGESIYEPMAPVHEDNGINSGGVHFDLSVNYLTDYVFRGVDQSERLAATPAKHSNQSPTSMNLGAEDAPNLQFDGRFEFDLGKIPHPVAGLFVNIFNDDPVSQFQEIRPYFGFEWTLRPMKFSFGHTTYIYPEREQLNTAEVWASASLDDSRIWKTDGPVLSPYVLVAYDYDLYRGTYIEAGVKHDFVFEGTGVTVTAVGDIAYVTGNNFFTDIASTDQRDSGFQHYDIGLVGSYSLNNFLNIPRRYGKWSFVGYLYYTDGIDVGLAADTQIWGGVGLRFQY